MLSNLQVLRAIAALNVVYFHIIITSFIYGQGVDLLNFLGSWGASGVDIFFVLSGFIMVYIQDRKRRTALSFLFNRIVRITPIYWFLTTVLLVIYIILPSAFRELTLDVVRILSSFMFSSGFLGYGEPILYVGWTLEYEMLFYVLFSVGIIFDNKVLSFLTPIILLFLLILLNVTGLIVLDFVLGMFCAKIYLSKKYNYLGFFSLFIGTITILASIFYEFNLDYRFIFYGIPAFFIVFGLITIQQTKNKLLVYLGDASYIVSSL